MGHAIASGCEKAAAPLPSQLLVYDMLNVTHYDQISTAKDGGASSRPSFNRLNVFVQCSAASHVPPLALLIFLSFHCEPAFLWFPAVCQTSKSVADSRRRCSTCKEDTGHNVLIFLWIHDVNRHQPRVSFF
jgi:hypothetical protein